MDSSLSSNEENLASVCQTSSPASLLERGIQCFRQGYYVEGAAIFTLVYAQLSPDQMHLAAVLDAFTQCHARYLEAQQVLHTASKHFVEADTEQQRQLAVLEKLLPALAENTDKVSQPHPIAQPTNDFCEQRSHKSLQLLSSNPDIEQPLPASYPSPKDGNSLPGLYFTCFGRFGVRRLGQPVSLCTSRSGQNILRYLVAQPEHCATMDVLMVLLWPEDEQKVAQPKLHSAISALRRSLNQGYSCDPGCGYIVCRNRIYSLNPRVVIHTDVDEFLQCYQSEWQTSEEQAALYEKACSLYSGPFLPEDLYADWSQIQREHLNRIYLAMCRVLVDHHLKHQHYEDAARWATAILNVNRCDEEAHRQLMQVYAAQGLRSEALQQYQRCEHLLREELGMSPLPETTLVFQKLLTSGTPPNDTVEMQ